MIVLEEYADLAADIKNRTKLESLMGKLSAKARAAGIHLIVITQKPIVKIINNVVKANLPTRLAFKVTSNVDSRIILDEGGAELLNDKGDGIFKSTSTDRFQCALVYDPERES